METGRKYCGIIQISMVILWNSSGNLEESMQPIGPSIEKVVQKCSERSTPWMVLQGSCVDEDV